MRSIRHTRSLRIHPGWCPVSSSRCPGTDRSVVNRCSVIEKLIDFSLIHICLMHARYINKFKDCIQTLWISIRKTYYCMYNIYKYTADIIPTINKKKIEIAWHRWPNILKKVINSIILPVDWIAQLHHVMYLTDNLYTLKIIVRYYYRSQTYSQSLLELVPCDRITVISV